MKRPDTPPPDGLSSSHGSTSSPALGGAVSAGPTGQQPLTNSLHELLLATDRGLPGAMTLLPSAAAAGGGATDLELLLLLQRQRERMAGVNSLLLQQQQQQQLSQRFGGPSFLRHEGLLPSGAAGLLGNSAAAFGGAQHGDAALLREAEAFLAMQRQGPLAPFQQQLMLQEQQQQDSIPADISAVLNARFRRMQEQQEQAALQQQQEAANATGKGKKASSSTTTSSGESQEPTKTPAAGNKNKYSDKMSDEDDSESGSSNDSDGGEGKAGEKGQETGAKDSNGHQSADFPVNDTFPYKLYRMLENAEKQGQEDIAAFTREGKAFIIRKPDEFVAKIMPHYFTSSRMTSFQRQLNLYGFRRIAEGADKGAYYHKNFIKGKRKLCKKIKRKKTHPKPPPVFLTSHDSLQGSYNMMQSGSGLPAASAGAFGGSGLSSLGLGSPPLPPSMSGLLQQQSGLGLSPALLEMRQRQQQSDLVRLLLQQQQEQQRSADDPSKNVLHRFFPPGL